MAMRNPKVGERIYYTGDMANQPDWGIVTRWGFDGWGQSADLAMDSGKTIRQLSVASFQRTPGARFVFEDAWKSERAQAIRNFEEAVARMRAEDAAGAAQTASVPPQA